jgi:methionyl aminopeptidase
MESPACANPVPSPPRCWPSSRNTSVPASRPTIWIRSPRISSHRIGARSADYGYQIGSRRFPAYICVSVNEEVVHGIGNLRRILRDGDIVSLDVTVEYHGYIGDNAVTVPVGRINPRLQQLLLVTERALHLGIDQARVDNRIGDISATVQEYVEAHGFSMSCATWSATGSVFRCTSRRKFPTFGRAARDPRIKPGMTLAIEPMVNAGGYRTKTLADGWTVATTDGSPSAHFEHTVLTTDRGPEILTLPRSA